MSLVIPYCFKQSSEVDLQIETPENCAIEVNDGCGAFQYLAIVSKLGKTVVFKYGPVNMIGDEFIDFEDLPPVARRALFSSLTVIATDSKKIAKIIRSFVQTEWVEQATEVSLDYMLDKCRDLKDIFRGCIDFGARTNN